MKPVALVFLLILVNLRSAGQSGYWQQDLRYTIHVTLDDKAHTLDGDLSLLYINHSPDTLRNIWFHLWPNAYKNDRTAFSEQMLENGNTSFYFSDPEDRGYINGLDFRSNGKSLRTEDHPSDIDITNVILTSWLKPGDSITVTTPFHVKLPRNFSRGGHLGNQYTITQWYPKPAVYDKQGWHTMPYLDQGEYYAEFGNYDVTITVPKDYIVAATGMLQDSVEKDWVRQHSAVGSEQAISKAQKSNSKQAIHKPQGGKTQQRVAPKEPTTYNLQPATFKTLHFHQPSVHDFAWFADKNYIVRYDTIILASGRKVDAYCYYHPKAAQGWNGAMGHIKTAVRLHSEWLGEYPYDVVSVVEGVQGQESGMEYPTITFIHDLNDDSDQGETIFHEVGHNWLQGVIANDERRFPWMDEGINTYYDNRYMSTLDRSHVKADRFSLTLSEQGNDLLLKNREATRLDQPIATSSDSMHQLNYSSVTYWKTSQWMQEWEKKWGRTTLDSVMRNYYRDWKFKHPYPEDLEAEFAAKDPELAKESFAALHRTGPLSPQGKKPFQVKFGYTIRDGDKYNRLFVTPLVGYNLYDGLMPGVLLHNYGLPPSRFQYAAAGMYGIASKKLNGISRISYSIYPVGAFRKIDLFLSGAHFSMDKYTDSSGKKWFQTFSKIAPGIRVEFREPDLRSSRYRFLQYKMYSISEDQLTIRRDTINDIDIVGNTRASFLLHQLTASWEDMRKLYPYKGEFKAEFTQDIARLTATGRYFFNFRKKGGVDLRVFAGKFFYLGSRTPAKEFQADRFQLNMTGPKGYEDYTYSDYYFGRNAFEGISSQQIMERDGNFKVRTDLLGKKVGKSDDWLVAMNLVMDVPDRFNPLAALPFKIPLKLYADIGTQSGAWGKDADGQRILFDGGIALHLLHSRLRVYVPLVYSGAYRDYFKSVPGNNFFQRISFSLDLREDMIRKLFRQGFE